MPPDSLIFPVYRTYVLAYTLLMKPIIFHVDVNNAFLSWEAVYRLKHLGGRTDLREQLCVVGGDASKRHGIVLAKSLSAKACGIHTGESLMEARQKCPDLLVVPPHYRLYSRCSRAFMDILREYTPCVEQYSIDEAFMDMSGTQSLWGDPLLTADTLRRRIHEELGFTVNIGISENKLLAKMASDFQKPNRTHTLFPEEIPHKMWPLPVTDLFFVGRASFSRLRRLGISTIGELAHTDRELLRTHFKSYGEVIWNYANGRDCAQVESVVPPNKGYGNSTTIAFDICDTVSAGLVLLSLAETIGMRLRRDHVKIQVIAVSIKYADFSSCAHQKTLPAPTNITNEIYHTALELFRESWDGCTPIRHLGIHTNHVRDNVDYRQLHLLDMELSPFYRDDIPCCEKLEQADAMADRIRSRYGIDSLKRAVFVKQNAMDHMSGGITREKLDVDYEKESLL
ncbi:DNA polymerase IV [Eisenbergiella tayi]|uniref:DNA polymerase IV n=2 Tax=Eisenbergiella tayi TaxID=1432052 RepID=A0A1E3AGC6_9FIRM|nr:DNA polymerase IV [Eisenbergiella tayi]